MSAVHPLNLTPAATGTVRCRYCEARLDASRGDFVNRRVCAQCRQHPSSREPTPAPPIGARVATLSSIATGSRQARAFTTPEKSLIRKVHGFLHAQQLLDLLNDRLVADLGPAVVKYTMEQLQAELVDQVDTTQTSDWAGLRKTLALARRAGLLDTITPQILDDFTVVYQLSAPQAMRLKEILASSHSKANGEAA